MIDMSVAVEKQKNTAVLDLLFSNVSLGVVFHRPDSQSYNYANEIIVALWDVL